MDNTILINLLTFFSYDVNIQKELIPKDNPRLISDTSTGVLYTSNPLEIICYDLEYYIGFYMEKIPGSGSEYIKNSLSQIGAFLRIIQNMKEEDSSELYSDMKHPIWGVARNLCIGCIVQMGFNNVNSLISVKSWFDDYWVIEE